MVFDGGETPSDVSDLVPLVDQTKDLEGQEELKNRVCFT